MNLNNSIKNPCDPYENYLDKKACIKNAFWFQPQARLSMHEL